MIINCEHYGFLDLERNPIINPEKYFSKTVQKLKPKAYTWDNTIRIELPIADNTVQCYFIHISNTLLPRKSLRFPLMETV